MSDNKNMKEKISALADGELSEFEVRRILDEISANPDYREFWRNIHITKNGLLDEVNSFHESDISKKLKNALLKSRQKRFRLIEIGCLTGPSTQVHLLQAFVLLFYSQILIHSQQRILLQSWRLKK